MHGIHTWLSRFTQLGGLETVEVPVVSCAHCNQSEEDIKVVAPVAESIFILREPIAEPSFFRLSVCLLFLCEIESFLVQAQAMYGVRN